MASARLRYAAVLAGAAVVGAATLVETAANAAPLDPVTFTFTAAEQTYHVPAGITSVRVKAIGAPGGDKAFDGTGGSGGGGGGGWYGGGGGGGSELHDVAGGGGGGGSSGVGVGARLVSLTVATSRRPSITITPLVRLVVKRSGNGAGTVIGNDINCGKKCIASFPAGTHVTLTARAKPGSRFAGWSGDCSGHRGCSLTMAKAHTVTARFTTQ